VSYGITGNDGIGDYQYYDLYRPTNTPYQGSISLYPDRLNNPDISWEETKSLNLGLIWVY